MPYLKHLISKDRVRRVENYRSNEVSNALVALFLLLGAYIALNFVPVDVRTDRFETIQNFISLAMVIFGVFLSYSLDQLMNVIKTK